MNVRSALSWVEFSGAVILTAFGLYALYEYQTAPPNLDPHGLLAAGGTTFLALAAALGMAGLSLRLRSRWSWLGQIPLLAIIVGLVSIV